MQTARTVWVFVVWGAIFMAALGCQGCVGASSGAGNGPGNGPGNGNGSAGAGGEEPGDPPQGDARDDDGQGDDGQDDVMDPNDPRLEVDPQVCEVDSDCMVGTPRDCCTGFCPEHAVAWSHAAWAAYQEECAVEECAAPESLACQPERELDPAPSARCLRERCVLR